MKVAFILVAIFAVLAVPSGSSSIEERGISDTIEKIKQFLEYMKSKEFQDKIKSIENHIKQAPEKAIECFKAASEGTKGDREAAIQALNELFHKAFSQDDSKDKNMFEKLLDLAQGIAKVLADPDFGKNMKEIGSEYQEAVSKAVGCFKDELKAVKGDVDGIIADIKSKFF